MSQATERAQKMLKKALEMEEKGYHFYEKAIGTCNTTLGKDIFKMLRDDEMVHVDRIKSIYTLLEGAENWNDEWKAIDTGHDQLSDMFRNLAKKNGPEIQADAEDIKALEVGIDFEATAVKFYEEHMTEAEDEKEKEFIEKMILEEKDHHRALVDMHQYLNNPEAWFEETDRIGLDGA